MKRCTLVAAAAVLASAALLPAAMAAECRVTLPNEPDMTLYPGRFDGGPAPLTATTKCPVSTDPVPGSPYPWFLGTATAAYQVEGAAWEDGRGVSIWDTFAREVNPVTGLPYVYQNQTGDVADDFYHRYLEDIQLMRQLGIRNFRLSIAWPRIFPNGTGEVNQAGVQFYNDLIDALKANCIEPFVTVFHWDLPQALQDRYGGWLGYQVAEDFAEYAGTVFELFGDRVKYWATINEPQSICNPGYSSNGGNAVRTEPRVDLIFPPGQCSNRSVCATGNSTTENAMCTYNVLRAHALAVQKFREYVPNGMITMTQALSWVEPRSNSSEDVNATARLNAYNLGQFLDPFYTGDWTPERREVFGDALPEFTDEDKAILTNNTMDYIAPQYYTGVYGYSAPNSTFLQANTTVISANGTALPQAESPWLFIMPQGLRNLLVYLDQNYDHPIQIITENGVSVPNENAMALEESLCDTFRINYYKEHMDAALQAVQQDGVDLRGYFAWSLMDNFEWNGGYSVRFGIVHVDFDTLWRYFKATSLWLSNFYKLTNATTLGETVAPGEEQIAVGTLDAAGSHQQIPPNTPGLNSADVNVSGGLSTQAPANVSSLPTSTAG